MMEDSDMGATIEAERARDAPGHTQNMVKPGPHIAGRVRQTKDATD